MLRSLAFLLLISSISVAQKPLIAVYKDAEFATPILTESGKLAFVLPAGHTPLMEYSDILLMQYTKRTITIFDKVNAWPIIGLDEKFYLVDRKGKKIKNIEGYTDLKPAGDGMLLGKVPMPGTPNKTLAVYLNSKGEDIFQRTYFQADRFSEGKALVRADKNARWSIINLKGKTIATLDSALSSQIYEINPFKDGFAQLKLSLRDAAKTYVICYIDATGKIVADTRNIATGNFPLYYSEFSDNCFLFITEHARVHRLTAFSREGKKIFMIDSVDVATPFAGNLSYIVNLRPKDRHSQIIGRWINKTGTVVPSPFKEIEKTHAILPFTEVIAHNNKYLQLNGARRATSKRVDMILEPGRGTLVFETTDCILGVSGERLLVRNLATGTDKLIQLPSKVLWQTSPGQIVYTNIQEALKVKESVKHFKVVTDEIPKELTELTQLEALTFDNDRITEIPVWINKFVKLKRLNLVTKSLRSFPKISFPELTHFSVHGGSSNWELEEFVANGNPTLQDVHFLNVKVSYAFEARIKKLRPNLKLNIETIHTVGEDFDLEIEEVEIEGDGH